MQYNNRQYLVAVILLAVSFVFVFKIDNAKGISVSIDDIKQFPQEIGDWKGRDIPLKEGVYESLGTRNVLIREYKNSSGDTLALAIVHSNDNRTSFHPPELCYTGGGVEILDRSLEEVILASDESLMTNKLVMQDKRGIIKAWYWFASRDKFTHSFCVQQLSILINGLKYNRRDGALIRVSAIVDKENPQDMEIKAKKFIKTIAPLVKSCFEKKS